MPRRTIQFLPDHYYHIYNRGHNYSTVFLEEENYAFFLRQLRRYIVDQFADILAYVLMPNHYHLLVKLNHDGFSHAMQNFSISFTKAMNERFNRVGSMFQGAFQARIVDKDEYLLHLSRYIHLNPMQAGLVKKPHEWIYSSYPEYIGLRKGLLPKPDFILGQFIRKKTSEVWETSEVLMAHSLYREFVEGDMNEPDSQISHLTFD